ncbi:cyclin-D3-2-like [Cornus florida]|uniref:cyclin-D3-2-like n=1 Tax=Cornus florida TaxID=4283 RepID=UPI00289AC36A|nr:cyclin-D3-2-like [Cornus florida]XP_059652616.1 cyclin-D3-2-like [Cornus florida]
MVARREAVEWILRVNAHFGFTALTTVLAVDYFDRFKSSFCFQRDKPWMSQLAAVACLSLAAKVEETQVPPLLNLQVEGSKYVFEAKTIQRKELLVLSALQWKMNPVTPLSFFDHIVRRLGLKTHLHFEFLWRCERLILSVSTDARCLSYLPSELATVTMLHVIEEFEPCNALDYQNQLMGVLKINKDKVDDCYKLILELSGNHGSYKQYQTHKRKYQSAPGSPNGVIDAYFSCDSSNDSWDVASSVSSSPKRLFKKSRNQDQQMWLAQLNPVSVGVFGGRG